MNASSRKKAASASSSPPSIEGPGIRDVDAALRDDYSGRGGLGLGLPGARRLMDDFRVESDADNGTTVTMRKRRYRDELARGGREERRRGG